MKTMKYILLFVLTISLFSCSDDDAPVAKSQPINAVTVANLHAPQTGGQGQGPIGGAFTKFDFSTGQSTTSATDWDIAFRGTTIIVNGGEETGTNDEPARNGNAGAYIVDALITDVDSVNTDAFAQDAQGSLAIPTGSENGWYIYDFTTHLINPILGKTLVFRTRNNRYAKVKITSYYKDEDPSVQANARYYTFDYVYQPNEGVTNF